MTTANDAASRPRFPTATTTVTTDERQPLLAHYTRFSDQVPSIRQPTRSHSTYNSSGIASWPRRVAAQLQEDISTRHTEWLLLACFFINGMVDAGAYNAYECFVGMVTGNTIFLGLGISNLPVGSSRWAWAKSLCSILAFFVGTFAFSRLHHAFGARRRWTLVLSFATQAIAVLISAVLLAHNKTSEAPKKPAMTEWPPAYPGFNWLDLIPISLLSFQASAKILTSRLLEQSHLATVVLTVLYADLIGDPALLTGGLMGHGKRNARIGGAVLYFLGAVAGGALAAGSGGFQAVLWIAFVANLALTASWVFWRAEKVEAASSDAGA